VNGARSQHGLPALTVDPRLVTSAHRHDLAMAQADTMSHQLPGEPSAGQRMTAAGVSWTYCEENVGWSGDLSNGGVPGALSVHQQMMAEGPPPAGQSNHYSDILSAQVNRIGIDVIADPAHGKIWLTEDFAKE
jgi:uncharacterized protein YkwD